MAINEYFRMQNVFGPQKAQFPSMSNENLFGNPSVQPESSFYDAPQFEPEPTPAMDAFTETVLNPPETERPSWKRMIGTGLLSALQGSTGEESRVPVYNAAGRKIGTREAGFWESLGNKPFNVAQASSILDMPHKAAVEDYKLRAGGLQQAANIEKTAQANQALAAQRYAQAGAIPRRENRADYLASLKDLPDSELQRLITNRQISIQDARDAAAMRRVEKQQAGATERVEKQQAGALERTREQQAGANTRNQNNIAAALKKTNIQQAGATERAKIGSKSATLPSQQKTEQLLKANEVLNQHPEWDEYIDVDPNTGVVRIAPEGTGKPWFGNEGGLDKATRDQIYSSIYGTAPPATQQTTQPPGTTTPPTKPTTKPPPAKGGGKVEMVTPDGKSTRMVSPEQVELAKRQGFKVKGK